MYDRDYIALHISDGKLWVSFAKEPYKRDDIQICVQQSTDNQSEAEALSREASAALIEI